VAVDLVDISQRYLRNAGAWLRGRGVVSKDEAPRRSHGGELRDRHFEEGRRQVALLAEEVEAYAGRSLASCCALDFGCGFGRMALPLAELCQHVYGLDISSADLQEADRNAERLGIENVSWLDASAVSELSGNYDFVLSNWVFAHINSRQGEKIFGALVQGLRPGGFGAIHVTLRPRAAAWRLISSKRSRASDAYLMMNSYSLNRLGAILREAGVKQWLVKWIEPTEDSTNGGSVYPSAVLIFAKP
jgi:2-polyprenyl-3-methyl-5-hydroxy-6-metoxy-1,4-benzoquinol methylase